MARLGISPTAEAIDAKVADLNPIKRVQGVEQEKTRSELLCEAKRKLVHQLANEHAKRFSLYALRHSFATKALRKGVDSMTVAILLGHEDPSTLARVYQHLNNSPVHLLDQMRRIAS